MEDLLEIFCGELILKRGIFILLLLRLLLSSDLMAHAGIVMLLGFAWQGFFPVTRLGVIVLLE